MTCIGRSKKHKFVEDILRTRREQSRFEMKYDRYFKDVSCTGMGGGNNDDDLVISLRELERDVLQMEIDLKSKNSAQKKQDEMAPYDAADVCRKVRAANLHNGTKEITKALAKAFLEGVKYQKEQDAKS